MDAIAIEKGIKMPAETRGRPPLYPWGTIKVGESFLFPKRINAAAAHRSVRYHNSLGKVQFAARKTDEGMRCWRIK